jgi:exonuclease SbcC
MIQSIQLINFQGHKNTTIDLSKGLNSLVGKSDSGKTSIIRAIKWVLTNRPSGDSLINHDAFVKNKQVKPCIVTITTDKHTIQRERSADINSYTIDGLELKAIGTDVPDEVVQALNLNDINIQFQLDSPFLLNETSGEVARMLNKVIKLDDIDFTLKNLNSYAKKLKQEHDRIDMQLSTITSELESIDITQVEQLVELGEMLEESYTETTDKITRLTDLKNEVLQLDEILNESELVAHYEDLINEMTILYNECEKVSLQASTMDTLIKEYGRSNSIVKHNNWIDLIDFTSIEKTIQEYNAISNELALLDSLITQYNDLAIPNIPDVDFSEVEQYIALYKDIDTGITILEEMITNYENSVKMVANLQKELQTQEVELKSMMGTICPLCNQPIEEGVDHVD